MDGDPSVAPELGPLGLYLPLPFRVSIIIVLGVWAWGVNLHYLYLLDIDVPSLIAYQRRNPGNHQPHYSSTYRLATFITIPLIACLFLFWIVTQANPVSVRNWEILPNLYLLILVICFFLPFHIVSGSGRHRFLTTLKRISVGGIAEKQDGKFGDILLADALTSYAKVLGDLFVSLCLFFSSTRSSTAHPDRKCGGSLIVPLILAVPSLIRLRQCLIEYKRAQWSDRKNSLGPSQARNHLMNALKYSTAFPVIILSAILRNVDSNQNPTTFRLWILFIFINSSYSFYWDVAKDWDLTLFSNQKDDPQYPWGLRRHRYFQFKEIYYFVVAVDLILRFTWSLKLSPHLDHFQDIEGGIFTIELLEVFRRWVWIFFRVETESVRSQGGPATVDILLNDFES